jgi:hypothetical protein
VKAQDGVKTRNGHYNAASRSFVDYFNSSIRPRCQPITTRLAPAAGPCTQISIAGRLPADYGVLMSRIVFLSIAIVLLLLPVVVPAAAARPAPRWKGYGFLPGYHQPPNNTLPAYAQKASVLRMARGNRRPWYIDPTPSYYGYDGDWHYFDWPGFFNGRYNGGSFGPCWTRTPIGPIWNCG